MWLRVHANRQSALHSRTERPRRRVPLASRARRRESRPVRGGSGAPNRGFDPRSACGVHPDEAPGPGHDLSNWTPVLTRSRT